VPSSGSGIDYWGHVGFDGGGGGWLGFDGGQGVRQTRPRREAPTSTTTWIGVYLFVCLLVKGWSRAADSPSLLSLTGGMM
jgi:hypothetical protein